MSEIVTKPTEQDIFEAGQWFDTEFCYCEGAMKDLFQAFPNNTKIHQVYLKIVALNTLYSTQIPLYNSQVPSLWEVADHIVAIGIDPMLSSGSPTVVGQIATIHPVSKSGRRNYSFATKYCSWHRPDAYPIFDSRVNEYLWHLKKLGAIPTFKRDALWDYPVFRGIVSGFRDKFGFGKFTFKDTVKFLYREGGKLLSSPPEAAQMQSLIEFLSGSEEAGKI
jgi:hypothetical protein